MASAAREPAVERIIDANLNRAAEGLRVVEDICRFGWELPALSRELKELRHAVLGAFVPGPESRARLSSSRDIEGDIGRASTSSLAPVDFAGAAVHNLERAKEALRSLEEMARLFDASLAHVVEGLRYRLYSIEKGILALAPRPRGGRMSGVRLCLLATRALTSLPLLEAVRAAIAGGVGAVQLREKGLPDRQLLEHGRALRELTAREGVPFIVNDRPDLALLVGADGVHLGQDDLPVTHARRLLGEDRLIGVSTHSADQARRAAREGADYIGAGPVYPGSTKDAGLPLGLEGLRPLLLASDLPSFAIGGIRPENITALALAGVRRVAVSAGVLGAGSLEGIREAARVISSALVVAEKGKT